MFTLEDSHVKQVRDDNIAEKDLGHRAEPDRRWLKHAAHNSEEIVQLEGVEEEGEH